MRPTGWFQVAWSADVLVGEVVRLHYFDTELIAYRGSTGEVHVLDAYCEHLGAHLGHGGTVRGDHIVCPFHGWEWDRNGRNVRIPYQERPNRARRIRAWPVTERNEAVFLWHDTSNRDPLYEVPDIFALFGDDADAGQYYRAHPECVLLRERLPVHPQYVIENGVDFAHFVFVHRASEMPRFTRQDFDEWRFHADFEMTFRPSRTSAAAGDGEVVHGGTQACNVGISLGFSRSWGTGTMRSMIGVTPVDENTSDIRSTTWLERLPGDRGDAIPAELTRRVRIANNQFLADVNIWAHQRYTEPPGLATEEARGFRQVRRWARRFYPPGEPGSGAAEQDAGVTG
ncbi:Rieske 2Fe-2S domain-containing protein [Solihabitans fulvus]|uniref:Rieske-type oxygenase n=2 Tax=Solihabitans fulvus TaxID=1892852 RepID=A0A5B2XDN7_9PSEU|nr:Rieske 2Fe-2S domain-containing protein [Solihabitans fulvus]